jgi:hypothetical protein
LYQFTIFHSQKPTQLLKIPLENLRFCESGVLCLSDFSKMVQFYFDGMSISPFQNWQDAFEYIDKKATKKTAISF